MASTGSTDSPSARRYLISGRVQGVGFRFFTRQTARELGLTGWVKNLADGRVEAVAVGPEGALDDFEGRLRQGPRSGRVSDVAVSEAADAGSDSFTDFEVRR
jgi:acylphosphatase